MDNEITVNDFTPQQPQQATTDLMTLHTGPVISNMSDILKYTDKDSLLEYANRKKELSHGKTDAKIFKFNTRPDTRVISIESNSQNTLYEIPDINKFTKKNKGAKKIFRYLLSEVGNIPMDEGHLAYNTFMFPVDNLVESKTYSTRFAAKRALIQSIDVLNNLKARGFKYEGKEQLLLENKNEEENNSEERKKKAPIAAVSLALFPTIAITEDNQCIVDLNPRLNWATLLQYYSKMPTYYMELSFLASELLELIFTRARQEVDNICKKGYFDISLRSVQFALSLPDENKIQKPNRDIKDRITEAIAEVKNTHNRYYDKDNELNITILPGGIEKQAIKNYLDTGFLRISFSGNFVKHFSDIHRTQKFRALKGKKGTKTSKGGGKDAEN